MEERANVAPEVELTIENWDAQFGEDGRVVTPIGEVKMGENQFAKLMRQDREGKLGMVKPTLETPDVIIEDASEAKDGDVAERKSSYVFVKAFKKADGSRYYYFTSVTVSKDGKEVVISNQEKRKNAIANLLTNGKLVWKHADDVSAASDVEQGLYSSQGNMSDPTTEGTDAPQTNVLSVSKGRVNSSTAQAKTEKIAENQSRKAVQSALAAAEPETNTEPTEATKDGGKGAGTGAPGAGRETRSSKMLEAERSIWQWLRKKVVNAINKFLGSLKLPNWFELGDNELRYILWRSKERLERGKEHPIDLARDIVKREELGLTDEARYSMGDAPETFKARQRRAVENKGTVMPGLNDAQVKVVDNIPRHHYTGNIAEATSQAIEAAKAKYAPNGEPKTLHYNNFGAEFDYSISGNAIETVLSAKHQGKSVNKGVHLALAEHLDRVIGESIEVEEHPDRIKTGDVRDNSKINPDALMHRFYGVANIDGVDYRVMTLMKEENKSNRGNGIHSYEVQKIEVLDEETPNTSNGVGTLNSELEGYPLAKVIKDVGKTMEKGKKLLDESKIADESSDLYREPKPNETEDIWQDNSLSLSERTTLAKIRLSNNHKENKMLKNDAIRAIGGNLSDLRKAMSIQREFDKTTAKRIYDLARILMGNGYLSNMSTYEISRVLAALKNSVGRNDIEASVQKVMDIMVDNQLNNAEATLGSLEKVRGSKVDARGVEVQGELDPAGQMRERKRLEEFGQILPSRGSRVRVPSTALSL